MTEMREALVRLSRGTARAEAAAVLALAIAISTGAYIGIHPSF